MFRLAGRLIFLCVLTALAILGWRLYLQYVSHDLQIQALQQKNDELERVINRLNVSNRVARLIVLDQQRDATGQLHTTLLWMENDPTGAPADARQFTFDGDIVHFDAEVIEFEHGYVEAGDALRGHSIALFTRAYAENQAPRDGYSLDIPGEAPAAYRDPTLPQSDFEKSLWRNFWRLYDDADYRKTMGVRVANGQGVWGKFAPGRIYTISVQANGGMEMTNEPADPMYLEAIRRAAEAQR